MKFIAKGAAFRYRRVTLSDQIEALLFKLCSCLTMYLLQLGYPILLRALQAADLLAVHLLLKVALLLSLLNLERLLSQEGLIVCDLLLRRLQ